MPGPTLPNMSLIVPLVDGDAGSWDTELNAAFGLIDEHDHAAGRGLQVPTSGININANLPLNGYALTTIGKLAFSEVAALAAGASTIFVSSADHELYWRTSAGVNVKITSGTSLNLSLVGGIVGDYAAVGAEVAYDNANNRYTFKQPTTWARLAAGDVRIYETGTSENVYVGLKCPTALAASYDVTWPLAVPASTTLMMMDASGVMTTPTTNITLPTDCNVTLTGLGRVIGGIRGKIQPVVAQTANVASGSVSTTTGTAGALQAISSTVYYPLVFGLDDGQTGSGASGGDRLESMIVYVSASGGSPTYTLMTASNGDGSFSTASSGSTSASSSIGLTVSAPAVTSNTYWVKVVTDGSTTVRILALEPRITRT